MVLILHNSTGIDIKLFSEISSQRNLGKLPMNPGISVNLFLDKRINLSKDINVEISSDNEGIWFPSKFNSIKFGKYLIPSRDYPFFICK